MVAIVISLMAFLIYLSTVCPTVYLGDSGELTAAAFSLGIPHNSGYPLYTILGKLFCLIPIGNIGFRMNLMSACFAALTLWIVYALIIRITSSRISAFVGTLFLAFIPVFWSQTVSAEVYPLHTFFVALLIRLLWLWDERREFIVLVLFVFITGISFGNHMQTVMLAPGVLFVILSGDRKAILNVRRFFILSFFFIVALSIYLYLPIRTAANAAIHWGDPDSLDRFMSHVTGRSHRGTYVMSKTPWEYVVRTKETILFVWSQFGVMLFFSLWGWLKLASKRWRTFFGLVILFDFIYTVFLNIISLKITAFTLPTSVVLAILTGIGIAHLLQVIGDLSAVGEGTQRLIRVAFCIAPVIALILNYGLCDQSRNNTGYEQAANVFRTVGTGDILFVHGDNYAFPVTYGRIAERMREDIEIYDRPNVLFKMPNMDNYSRVERSSWEDHRNRVEQRIIQEKGDWSVFYGVFNPHGIKMPDKNHLVPYGLLHRVAGKKDQVISKETGNLWGYYSTESFRDSFEKDFMNREVSAYFYFRRGEYLVLSGQPERGIRNMRLASQIGYDGTLIHSDMAVFLTDQGFFKEARRELEKALVYYEDLSGVHNNWGYYYHKMGEYNKAAASFRKAIELNPGSFGYHNNLGFSLYEAGRWKESLNALTRSLRLNKDQPEIEKFIEEHLLALSPSGE